MSSEIKPWLGYRAIWGQWKLENRDSHEHTVWQGSIKQGKRCDFQYEPQPKSPKNESAPKAGFPPLPDRVPKGVQNLGGAEMTTILSDNNPRILTAP